MSNIEFKQKSYKLSIITYITYEFKQKRKGAEKEKERKFSWTQFEITMVKILKYYHKVLKKKKSTEELLQNFKCFFPLHSH